MIAKLGFGVLMLNEGKNSLNFTYFGLELTLLTLFMCFLFIFLYRLSKSHILVYGMKGTIAEVFATSTLEYRKKMCFFLC